MTVVVGHLPERGGRAALHLGVALARALGTSLTVATVVRTGRHPAEDSPALERRRTLVAEVEEAARAAVADLAADVPVVVRVLADRSTSRALGAVAAETGARVLVLGSSAEGHVGQIVVGSTADKLLHSAALPVALAPRGFRAPRGAPDRTRPARITVATTGEDEAALVRARDLAEGLGVELRVLVLAVRHRPVLTSQAGFDAEAPVVAAWTEEALGAVAELRERGVLPAGARTEVGTGPGWREALDAVEWTADDLLVLGTPPEGPVARVFLGSRATKILRHAPVPVLVLPG
ncbi:universal stress protein [Kineococcus gynurae]|uniref:Universal stress protein n=1 Tax=Kineococcus gynurae TaxID=452979 RepID=A0ABV5LS43_9ACTN